MPKFLKKILLWIYLKYHMIMVSIGIALYNTEVDILKANPFDLKEGDKKIQRMRHRNNTLERFYAGNRDEKYVQDYYEVLKKADHFIRTSTPNKIAVATDKHLRFDEKDRYGKRFAMTGFFDEKHKHAGKTIAEVLELEYQERRTNDDKYELVYIFNNKPIEVGLAKVMDVIVEKDDDVFEVKDMELKSKQFEFPIKAFRDDETIVNKIEQLAEYVHIKQTAFEYRQLEFFIPLKYGTSEIEEDSQIFSELVNIKGIFVKNDYGEKLGFGIIKFIKRIKHNDTHEVWKFDGIEMQDMGTI
jgi:hypothetical protein